MEILPYPWRTRPRTQRGETNDQSQTMNDEWWNTNKVVHPLLHSLPSTNNNKPSCSSLPLLIMNIEVSAVPPAAATARNPYSTIDTSSIDHGLGRSENTIKGNKPALNVFSYWCTFVAKKNTPVSAEEIEEENLQSMFLIFNDWLRRTPIQKNH